MSKVKYIAVTLGPIFKTIGLAESTGALWAASYMFSYLSKSICEYLLEHSEFNISEEDIIVPYYHKNAAGTKEDSAAADVIVSDGVGRFPDHIIFRAKNFDVTNFSALRNSVIRSLADTFGFKEGEGDDYLRRYMLIACTAFDVDEENGENPILKSGLALDSLELFQPIIRVESCNEIVKAVSNRSIRELPLTQGFENWPLLGEDRTSIRSTEDIADTSKDGKVREQLKNTITMPSFAAMRMLFPKSLPRLKRMNCAIFQEPVFCIAAKWPILFTVTAALQFIPEATTCLRCCPPKARPAKPCFTSQGMQRICFKNRSKHISMRSKRQMPKRNRAKSQSPCRPCRSA